MYCIASVLDRSTYRGLNVPAWFVSVPALIVGANGGSPSGQAEPSEPDVTWNDAVSVSGSSGAEYGNRSALVVYVPHVAGLINGACAPSRK